MRDWLVTIIVFAALPFVFTRPYIGILLWSWISYMNPHRLGWGFAYDFPFAAIIGATTIIAVAINLKKLRFVWPPIIVWLLALNIWFFITTIFSLEPQDAWIQWQKVIKIQLMGFIALWVMGDKKRINELVWVIALSIGFFGVKGGIFTILTGGGSQVLGPEGSFISGNTEIALALVMALPLIWYLYLNTSHRWIQRGLLIAVLLTAVAIFGSYSRGALLAIAAMAFFLWLKSRKKVLLFVAMVAIIPPLLLFMPQKWHERMDTIDTYQEDSSAMGRIHAWQFAYKMASARPMTGGGFDSFTPANYERFAPGLIDHRTGRYQDSHSIYFAILGHHGFAGLSIFLVLAFLAWRNATKILRLTKFSQENKWAYDLASMIQVSFIGYAVGGAFLGLAYFDLYYNLLIILVLTLKVVEQQPEVVNDPKRVPLPGRDLMISGSKQ